MCYLCNYFIRKIKLFLLKMNKQKAITIIINNNSVADIKHGQMVLVCIAIRLPKCTIIFILVLLLNIFKYMI